MKPTIRFTAPRRAYVPGLRRASLLALLAASFPGAVRADTPPTASTPLDTIVVRSGAFERTADELVQRVDVLSGETLERNRRGTLGDVLNLRPGIASASFGPGVGRPVIRGQGGPRVQMLENGIASMDASSISADHAVSIDPLNADQIEVIKGPATLIYGGGASAGIVNVVDDRLPFGNTLEDAATDGISGNFGEKAFHLIEPRGRGWREVEVETGVPFQPPFDFRRLVGGVVIDNQVDIQAGKGLAVDPVQEANELLAPVALQTLPDDRAVEHVERREQGRRAVALVIMGHGPGAALLHGQAGLAAVEGLDLALLVN